MVSPLGSGFGAWFGAVVGGDGSFVGFGRHVLAVPLVAVGPLQQRRRGRRPRRRCRRAGRRARRSASGTVAIVKSRGSTSSISSQRDRRRDRAARDAPHASRPRRWCGRGRSGCSRRRGAVGSRSLRHHVVVTSSGSRRSTSRAKASAARRTSLKPVLGRDPDVDVQALAARRSSASRRRRARRAPRGRRGRPGGPSSKPHSGIGSRSMRHSSGRLGVGPAAVPRVELDRRHLHRPDHLGQLGHAQLVGVQAVAREVQPHGLDPGRRAGRQPLLVHLLARRRPSGKRCSMHGRSRSALTMPGADGRGSSRRGRAWSRRARGSRRGRGWRCARCGRRPRSPPRVPCSPQP